jgi:hypothetical protein
MRRTPEATALSETMETRPMSPVRPTWVPPHSSTEYEPTLLAGAHGDDAHLVAVFLAEQRARARGDGVVDRHQPRGDGRVLENDAIGDVLDARSSAGSTGLGWVKSKRRRSRATSEPFCATWSPST